MSEKEELGRRARKARETRKRIADAALGLFLQQGFDATTIDMIADAADISRRLFFNYYASKEAIVEAVDDGLQDAFREMVKDMPRTKSPLGVVYSALTNVIGRYSGKEAKQLYDLMHSTEGLRARKHGSYARQEEALYGALCEIWPDAGRQAALRIVAVVGIGAMRVAVDRWREDSEKRSLLKELERSFANIANESKDWPDGPSE